MNTSKLFYLENVILTIGNQMDCVLTYHTGIYLFISYHTKKKTPFTNLYTI